MSERIFTEGEVIQLVGYLNAAVPELANVESPLLLSIAEEGMLRIEDAREG
jgi:hypothetical protein